MFLRKIFTFFIAKSLFFLQYTMSCQYLRKYSYQSGKKNKKLIGGDKRNPQSSCPGCYITNASHVCSRHSFGLPLRINEMHRMQFDHERLNLLPLVILSPTFWPSVTGNLRKTQQWSKSICTFNGCHPHFLTFGYY